MPVQKLCKDCSRAIVVWYSTQTRCPKCVLKRQKSKYPVKNCKQCGKEYNIARPALIESSKYCSRECQISSLKKSVTRKCKVCYKEFDFKLSQIKAYKNAGVACSRRCANEYIVRKHANAPIKDKYGRTRRKADKEWQKAVRERDNYTCQRCGKYDQYIDTHHIALRSQRPDLKHTVENGVCLCRVCHMWAHHHPVEVKKVGLISDAKYGIEVNEQRRKRISEAKKTDGQI